MSKEKLYSEDHIWVLYEDNIAVIGLSDYAQKQLGTLAFINLLEVGEKYQIGDVFGDVESIKTVSDLICPVDGEVVEVNESLIDNPSSRCYELINLTLRIHILVFSNHNGMSILPQIHNDFIFIQRIYQHLF